MGKIIISTIGLVLCMVLNCLVAWVCSLLFKSHDFLQWFLILSTTGYYSNVFRDVYKELSEEYDGK